MAVLQQDYIAPRLSPHSLQACVATALESYGIKHGDQVHVAYLEDYRIHTSFVHLQYAIIHVLQFLQSHPSKTPIRLWITPEQGIHIRLSGQAIAPSLLQKLFSLFPAQETTHHLGLAISKLLIEAQGGSLWYATHASPQENYTDFTLMLPNADPPASIKKVFI